MPPKTGNKPPDEAIPSLPPNPLLEMLAASAGTEDIDAFTDEFTAKGNARNARRFARVPYSKRILLVPQCLRSSTACKATEKGVFYECARCGACLIDQIITEADRLGYMGVYILKGGRAIAGLIEKLSPLAIAGVACNYEGLIGIMECERRSIPVQFIPLSRDGCFDTEVDLDSLKKLLSTFDDSAD